MNLLLSLLLFLSGPAGDVTILDADGKIHEVRQVEVIEDNGSIALLICDNQGQKGRLPLRDVQEISFGVSPDPWQKPPAGALSVSLRSGDVMQGTVVDSGNRRSLTLKNGSLGTLAFPVEAIDQILVPMNLPFAPLRFPAAKSVAVVRGKNMDLVEGAVWSADSHGIRIEMGPGAVLCPWEVVSVVKFSEAAPASPQRPSSAYVKFVLRDESVFAARLVSWTKGHIRCTWRGDEPLDVPVDGIVALEIWNGRAVPLSQLTPTRVEEEANFIRGSKKLSSDLEFPYQRDRSARGSKIIVAGRYYRQGIGVRAHSSLWYALTPADERFQTIVGLDAVSMGLGAVEYEVRLDDAIVLTGTLKGNDPPVPVDLDVRGKKELLLRIKFAGFGQSDFVDWAAARIIRK
jgi:hypothetical protein